jgi:hypothetical protein
MSKRKIEGMNQFWRYIYMEMSHQNPLYTDLKQTTVINLKRRNKLPVSDKREEISEENLYSL